MNIFDAENCLKSFILEPVVKQVNHDLGLFFSVVKQTSEDVWGKEIRKAVEQKERHVQYISTLKNLYVTMNIPKDTVKKASDSLSLMYLLGIGSEINFDFDRIQNALFSKNDKSLTGLNKLFDVSKPLYGIEREAFNTPLIVEADDLNSNVIDSMIDRLEGQGSKVNMIICSFKLRNLYMQHLLDAKINFDTVNVNGDRCLSYNGIPLVVDKFVEDDKMYFLNTDSFVLHQLCDWRWLEDERDHILREDYKGDYTAILVKYADLICDYPNRQGMIVFDEV